MSPKNLKQNQLKNLDAIKKAAEYLRAGKLVAFPTETVYGLGADAANPEAVKKVFKAKGRPADHPLIVHLADISQLTQWAREVSPIAYALAKHFWPGPLTLILPKAPQVLDLITGGQDTIGLRIPHHPVAQALLQAFDGGIAAPSANRFGHISPTRAEHVQADLGAAVDLILEGEPGEIGIESTIVDVSADSVRILRPGMITATEIAAVIQRTVATGNNISGTIPRVSGALEAHYSPNTKLKLTTVLEDEIQQSLIAGIKTVILARKAKPGGFQDITWIEMPQDPYTYAQVMYLYLHQADDLNLDLILVEQVPEQEVWLAIRDRLYKAAAKFML